PFTLHHSRLTFRTCGGFKLRQLVRRSGASLMKILALEFSSPQRSVAVVQAKVQPPGAIGNWQLAIGDALSEIIETSTRAANALAMIEAALRQAQLEREQVQTLAIG